MHYPSPVSRPLTSYAVDCALNPIISPPGRCAPTSEGREALSAEVESHAPEPIKQKQKKRKVSAVRFLLLRQEVTSCYPFIVTDEYIYIYRRINWLLHFFFFFFGVH